MVIGIESFKDKFKDYADCYTVIGGAACDILMMDAEQSFRATKDIDMILILENRYQEFAAIFWEFIKEGGYKCGWKNSKDMHFYRFTEPKPGYPVQIELFSRKPDYHLSTGEGIIPIHIDDDTSSLSAILLNDEFYDFMLRGRKLVDGISVLGPEYLIPFKMYAWLDLMRRKENGEHVNEKDLRKHKYDVFRLLQIVIISEEIQVTGMVKENIDLFLDKMLDEALSLEQIGLPFDKKQALELLRRIYI